MVETELLSKTNEGYRLVREHRRVIANARSIIQGGEDVHQRIRRQVDVGDRRISTTEIVAERPVGARTGERNRTGIDVFLNAGVRAAAASRNLRRANRRNLLTRTGDGVEGDVKSRITRRLNENVSPSVGWNTDTVAIKR